MGISHSKMESEEVDEKKGNHGWKNCKLGHDHLIPASTFQLSDLPEFCRDEGIFRCIKRFADLTVKVVVNYVSDDRPANDPFSKLRGRRVIRTGSGTIMEVKRCETPGSDSTVLVSTAKHVVFDDKEARETTVELFYDDESNTEGIVQLQGSRLIERKSEDDYCVLECVLNDRTLADELQEKSDTFKGDLKRGVIPDCISVMVIHPHGASKEISITGPAFMFHMISGDPINEKRGLRTTMVRNKDHPICEIAGLDVKVIFPEGTEKMCRLTLLAHSMDENLAWILYGEGVATPREVLNMIWEDSDKQLTPIDRTKTLEDYVDLLTFPGKLKLKHIQDDDAANESPGLIDLDNLDIKVHNQLAVNNMGTHA